MLIETRRFRLRDFEESDLDAFADYRSDPRFAGQSGGPADEPTPRQLLDLFLAWKAEEPRLRYQLAIVERATDRLLGTCGLRMSEHDEETAEVGLELAADQWGRHGAALEVTDAILGFGFGTLGLFAVVGHSTAGNAGAARLAAWGGAMAQQNDAARSPEQGVSWRLEQSQWLERRGRGGSAR